MIKRSLFILYSLSLAICSILVYRSITGEPEPVIIQGETVYNTIYKPVKDMSPDEVLAALNCHYTSIPALDIKHIEGNLYMLSAGLCERKWHKTAQIISRSRDYPHNLVLANMVISSRLTIGVQAQYYYFVNNYIGFGGGVSLFPNDSIQVIGGVALKW